MIWSKKINHECRMINAGADYLKSLAYSFDMTGNQEVAKILDQLANDLKDSTNKIEEAKIKQINDAYKESQKEIGDLLMMAMGIDETNNKEK